MIEIILANPRGFCAGVERAIEIVEEVLRRYPQPVYVRHEIVHNEHVVKSLEKKGVIFVKELSEVPQKARVVFSAHGVAQSVYEEAQGRDLITYDATCPLVKKVHQTVHRYAKGKMRIILIGHVGHPEVVGTMGQLKGQEVTLIQSLEDVEKLDFSDTENLAYTTQTTLSVYETMTIIAALKKKYPHIQGPSKGDMCYATTNRQEAIIGLAKESEAVLVVGSKNSSNSNRLVEMAKIYCEDSYLVPNLDCFDLDILKGKKVVGISSGASAPEKLVQDLIEYLKKNVGVVKVRDLTFSTEKVFFPLPLELRKK